MNICGINYESFADGEGIRAAIFVSGCSKKCPECHNAEAQNKNLGSKLDKELFNQICSEIRKRPFLSGITLTGGDPFESYNIGESAKLIHDLKIEFPQLSIWVYTGELFEDIKETNYYALCNIDVLVDGRFVLSKKDRTLQFKGSSNQRVIDIQKTLEKGVIVEWLKDN